MCSYVTFAFVLVYKINNWYYFLICNKASYTKSIDAYLIDITSLVDDGYCMLWYFRRLYIFY